MLHLFFNICVFVSFGGALSLLVLASYIISVLYFALFSHFALFGLLVTIFDRFQFSF